MLFMLSLMPDCTFERSIWLHHYSLNVKKALWWEWEIPCLHMGVMPSGEPWPLLSLSLQRALPIVPITVLCRSLWMCVCVCVLTNLPLLFQIPPSHPLPPISLSHPLSCAHSLILSRAKNWQSSSSSQKLPSSHWLRQPGLCNSFRTPLYSPPPPTLGLLEITNEGWRWFISRFIAYPCMD